MPKSPIDINQQNQPRSAPWRAQVLTLFPELFPGPLDASLVGKALHDGIWSLQTTALRAFGLGKHRTVDDRPVGGGPGMVMRADVLGAAIDHARKASDVRDLRARVASGDTTGIGDGIGNAVMPLIYLSPRGEPLTQNLVRELAAGPGAIMLAGRFEGIDERVIEGRAMREISIGDYVMSGGELAAMVLIDAVVRLLPDVLGSQASAMDESFEQGLLEYPQFARPRDWEGRSIPQVLLSGDHQAIANWRQAEAELLTKQRRPDLWAKRQKG